MILQIIMATGSGCMLRIFTDSLVYAIGFCIMFILSMKVIFGVTLDGVTRIRKIFGYLSVFTVAFILDVLSKYQDDYKPVESFVRYFISEILSYFIVGAILYLIYFFMNKFINRKKL